MDVRDAYNIWANQYDSDSNKTRDIEAISLRTVLDNISFSNCLEIGCGTGKNTTWLVERASHVTAVDFSVEMLAKAKVKIDSPKIDFIQVDIKDAWSFADRKYDLVVFSLVLEHIENLANIFEKVSNVTTAGSLVYIGELHSFKQYTGSKATFETTDGSEFIPSYNHHISDFTMNAKANNFEIVSVNEFFDNNDRTNIPRILALLLKKA